MKVLLAATVIGLAGLGVQPESKQKPVGTIVIEGQGLESLSFLKGTWSGKMGDDWVEETWSAPHGDSIIGMFRWQAVGQRTTMWELLSIKSEGGKPPLRLRHFDAKFDPWKSESGSVDAMPAVEISGNRVLFAAGPEAKGGLKSVEYKCPSGDVLEITVRFKDEGREALEFDLARQKK